MKTKKRMIFTKEILISVLAFILFYFIGNFFIGNNSQYMETQINQLSQQIADSQASVLEKSIKRTTASAVILGHHIHTIDGDMSDFESYAAGLHKLLDGITNLQLAPDGVVSKIYPLQGHEKAIGHDIFKSDARKKEAFLAKRSRALTIAGPFRLIQGGIAIIARSPVYLHDTKHVYNNETHQHSTKVEKFWGFASALVYLQDLLKTTDLYQLEEKNYEYRLWRYHPDTEKRHIFAGNQELPGKNMLTRTINIPGGHWFLDIEYVGKSFSGMFISMVNIINILVAVLLGYLLYLILKRPEELRNLVEIKTHELQYKNAQLHKEKLELKKLTNAIKYNSNAIFITNEQGIIEYINPALREMTGYTFDDFISKHTDIFQAEISTVMKNKRTLHTQCEYKNIDNESLILVMNISVIKDKKGNISSLVGVCEDITKRVQYSEELSRKENLLIEQAKLASMGEMIGNIAHQWRQPLSAISTLASGIKVKSELDDLQMKEVLVSMDDIVQQTQYLSRTIDDFRNFIKNSDKKEDISIKHVVEQSLSILQSSIKNHNIQMVLNLKDDLKIDGYENELMQVVINIFNNAKDALKENVDMDDNRFIFIDTKENKENFIISIKDNAGGILEKFIDRVFEPYFTTKHQSIGTGIGLSMSYQIITEHHDGSIQAFNESYMYHGKQYTGAVVSIMFNKK